MLGGAKTRPAWRGKVCIRLEGAGWVREQRVELGDVTCARANEDDFDALFTVAAVLRCLLEDRPLCAAD